MMDAILALALLLTTASQLRLPGAPVGPGELGLAVWIVGTLFRALATGAVPGMANVSALLAFWGTFALALSVGMIMAMASGEAFESALVLHDALAYVLIAVVSCLYAATASRLRRVAWLLVIFGAVSLSLQFANGLGLFRIHGIDPWYWERLRGWSDNPNQLAIICLIMTLLAWYLADTAASFGSRLAAILFMIPPLVVGRMSKNDTLLVALAAAVLVWFAARLIFCAQNDQFAVSLRASIARLVLVSAPVLVLCLAPLVLSRMEVVTGLVLGLGKNGGAEAADEANLRMTLWHQAIERGIYSGMLGLGPGPHLRIPPTIVAGRVSMEMQPANVEHPIQNGTANFEAHNTLLDVFTQGGLLAGASVVWLLLRAINNVYRARSAGLASLLAGVTIFMMTGNIVRQPIFWFAIVLCLTTLASRRDQRRQTQPA
jgi:hypothetical protein